MIFPLLLLLGGGYAYSKASKKAANEKKLYEAAQKQLALAEKYRLEKEACARQLAKYNPPLNPSFLDPASAAKVSGGDNFDIWEGGESPDHI